jgi:hypothetical protein
LVGNHENLPKQPQNMAGKSQNSAFSGEKCPQNLIIQKDRFKVRNVSYKISMGNILVYSVCSVNTEQTKL